MVLGRIVLRGKALPCRSSRHLSLQATKAPAQTRLELLRKQLAEEKSELGEQCRKSSHGGMICGVDLSSLRGS